MNDNGIGRHDNDRLQSVLSSLLHDYDRYETMVGDIIEFWESDSITSEEYFRLIADLLSIAHEIARQTYSIEWILTNRGQDIHA